MMTAKRRPAVALMVAIILRGGLRAAGAGARPTGLALAARLTVLRLPVRCCPRPGALPADSDGTCLPVIGKDSGLPLIAPRPVLDGVRRS